MFRLGKSFYLLLLFCTVGAPLAIHAAAPDHWVGTWAASPVGALNAKGTIGATDLTLRQIVHVSIGGTMARVILTNEFGTEALTIGAAHFALHGTGTEIQLASANALTFNGQPTVVIPAGALVVSDPTALKLPALTDVVISLYIPAQPIAQMTQHSSALTTNYAVDGNHVGEKALVGATEFFSWRF